MPKYLRVTHWSEPTKPGMTVVVAEADLKAESNDDAVEGSLAAGFFITYQEFEADDFASAMLATVGQLDRLEQDERNMAVAYFYYADALKVLTANGVLASTLPAPLSREQMAWVLHALGQHPNYQNQRVTVPLADGTTIEMQEGEVLPL